MAKVGDIEIESKVFETTKEMLFKYGVRGWNIIDRKISRKSEIMAMQKERI